MWKCWIDAPLQNTQKFANICGFISPTQQTKNKPNKPKLLTVVLNAFGQRHITVNISCDTLMLPIHVRYSPPPLPPSHWLLHRVFQIHKQVVDIGRSSATVHARLINKLDQKELAENTAKLVYINRATRQSAPFPAWMLRKYKSAVREMRPFTLPKNVPQVSFITAKLRACCFCCYCHCHC